MIVWEIERWPEDQGALERALDELVRETLALGARLGAVLEIPAAQAAVSLIGASGLLASSRVPEQVRQAPLDVLDADERELVERIVRAGVASEHSWIVFETLERFPERAGAAAVRGAPPRALRLQLRCRVLAAASSGDAVTSDARGADRYVGQPSRRSELVRGFLERGVDASEVLTHPLARGDAP